MLITAQSNVVNVPTNLRYNIYHFDLQISRQAELLLQIVPDSLRFLTAIWKQVSWETASDRCKAVAGSHRLSYDYMETRLYKLITSSLPLAISMFYSIALLHPTSCSNNNFSKRSAETVPNGTANPTRIGPSTKKIPFENVSNEYRVSIEFQMKRPSRALPR